MRSLSLKTKLFVLSGFLLLISALISGANFRFQSQTQSAFNEVIKVDVPAVRAVNRILLAYRLARIELLQAIFSETTQEEDEVLIKSANEAWATFDSNVKQFIDSGLDDEEKPVFDRFSTAASLVKSDFSRVWAIHAKQPAQGSPEEHEMMRIALKELPKHGDAVRDAAQKLIDLQAKAIDTHSENAIKTAERGHLVNLMILFVGIALGLGLTFVYTRALVTGLRMISQDISKASNEVSTASTQIASVSEEISSATAEQSASLQETTASLEEISATVGKNAESARESNRFSKESQAAMNDGKSAVAEVLSAIGEIDKSNTEIAAQIDQSNREISEIVKVIAEIGSKTKVINDIVFQTKLLSFNASVEAARAGEHGKGFAVVAEEVGNLAQMSGNAAKEISAMLDGSIRRVEEIVQSTRSRVESLVKSGKSKIEAGSSVARRCDEVFGRIALGVGEVGTRVGEIATASTEQAQGILEINTAMSQLDQVTQKNASVSQQSASAAAELSAQAAVLSQTVARLIQTIEGGQAHPGLTEAYRPQPEEPRQNVVVFAPRSKEKVTGNAASSAISVPARDDARFGDV